LCYFFFDSISLVGVFVACFADSTFLFGVELGIVFFESVSLNGIFESVSLGLFFGSLTDVFLGVVFFDSDVLSDFSLGDVSLEVVFFSSGVFFDSVSLRGVVLDIFLNPSLLGRSFLVLIVLIRMYLSFWWYFFRELILFFFFQTIPYQK